MQLLTPLQARSVRLRYTNEVTIVDFTCNMPFSQLPKLARNRAHEVIRRLLSGNACTAATIVQRPSEAASIWVALAELATPSDLLDELRRLAGQPPVHPGSWQKVGTAMVHSLNDLMSQSRWRHLPGGVIATRITPSLCAPSLLWANFETPPTGHKAFLEITDLQKDNPVFANLPPWLALLLRILAEKGVITGVDFGYGGEPNGMRLYSTNASPHGPDALKCLAGIVRAAEELSGRGAKRELAAAEREDPRWMGPFPALVEMRLERLRLRWLIALRKLASHYR